MAFGDGYNSPDAFNTIGCLVYSGCLCVGKECSVLDGIIIGLLVCACVVAVVFIVDAIAGVVADWWISRK